MATIADRSVFSLELEFTRIYQERMRDNAEYSNGSDADQQTEKGNL